MLPRNLLGGPVKHIDLDACDHAVREFFLTLSTEGGAVLEVGSRPVAHVLPVPPAEGEWTPARDERRCALIDREIAGALTPAEAAELAALQSAMLRHRRRVAPLPLDDARQLHRELLAKAAGPTS